MALKTRDIYASSNGDLWQLAQDEAGRVFVLHIPNMASGGKRSEISLAAFLKGAGPEQQELVRLIGTLLESSE